MVWVDGEVRSPLLVALDPVLFLVCSPSFSFAVVVVLSVVDGSLLDLERGETGASFPVDEDNTLPLDRGEMGG